MTRVVIPWILGAAALYASSDQDPLSRILVLVFVLVMIAVPKKFAKEEAPPKLNAAEKTLVAVALPKNWEAMLLA